MIIFFFPGEFATVVQQKSENNSTSISQTCWPDCAEESIKIVQVRGVSSV